MSKYKFEIIVNEQSDEFWEEATANGKSGCDEVLEAIKEELQNWDIEIKLIGYEPDK